jgi:hypothetical protein
MGRLILARIGGAPAETLQTLHAPVLQGEAAASLATAQ